MLTEVFDIGFNMDIHVTSSPVF